MSEKTKPEVFYHLIFLIQANRSMDINAPLESEDEADEVLVSIQSGGGNMDIYYPCNRHGQTYGRCYEKKEVATRLSEYMAFLSGTHHNTHVHINCYTPSVEESIATFDLVGAAELLDFREKVIPWIEEAMTASIDAEQGASEK